MSACSARLFEVQGEIQVSYRKQDPTRRGHIGVVAAFEPGASSHLINGVLSHADLGVGNGRNRATGDGTLDSTEHP